MRNRFSPAPRLRPLSVIHLRLARAADITSLTAFCQRHHDPAARPGRSAGEISALLHGHVDAAIIALQRDILLGVALCGVTKGRARLLELIVQPGPHHSQLERRLLRRSLRNLRTLGVRSLEFHPGAVDSRPRSPVPHLGS
jgi:hypothetical protein